MAHFTNNLDKSLLLFFFHFRVLVFYKLIILHHDVSFTGKSFWTPCYSVLFIL